MKILDTLLTPFTAPGAGGTTFRDIIIALGSVLTILGLLGFNPEWIAAARAFLDRLLSPEMLTAVGVLTATGMSIYRSMYKSTTPEGEAAARQTEKIVAGEKKDATIHTPDSMPDLAIIPKELVTASIKKALK